MKKNKILYMNLKKMENFKITFKDFSHISYKPLSENNTIKRINKGETYVASFFSKCFPKEDIVKKKRLSGEYICVAKENRWYTGDGVWLTTIGEVVNEWNNLVLYENLTRKWFNKAYINIHFLDGKELSMYFDTNEEMLEKLEELKEPEKYKTININ